MIEQRGFHNVKARGASRRRSLMLWFWSSILMSGACPRRWEATRLRQPIVLLPSAQ